MEFTHHYIPSSSGDQRTLLVLHGTGGDENNLLGLASDLLPEANVLSPRGRVSENGMPRFFRRFAEGVFDYDDIRLRSQELADFVRNSAEHYRFDPTSVYAVGYSNGANIAWSTLLLRPETLAGAVLLRPMVTLTDVHPDLSAKRLFVSSGRQDPIVPFENSENLVAQMREAGAQVKRYIHPGGHELGPQEVRLAKEWLAALPAG